MKYLTVLGIFAVVTGLIIQYPHAMINPGELVQAHADLHEKCLSCHQPFQGVTNEKCIACHPLADIGKNNTANPKILFHQNLKTQSCTACHTDHKGAQPDLALQGFRHDMLPATALQQCVSCHPQPDGNLHASLTTDCKSCHTTDGWKTGVTFNHDMLQGVNKNNCVGCHQKPADTFHRGISDNCATCHSTTKWSPADFDHSAYFVLDNDHNAKCAVCHVNNNYSAYTCYGCHEHTPANIRGEHTEEGITNFTNCVACHRSGDEHEGRGEKGDDD